MGFRDKEKTDLEKAGHKKLDSLLESLQPINEKPKDEKVHIHSPKLRKV